jgi:hypothetical protein
MSTIDAPAGEAAVAGVPLTHRASLCKTPLVLQVSPLPGASDPDEFFYDPFANVKSDDFAAARAFFIHHGHTVVYHDCPDVIAFQELFPLVTIGYLSLLPKGLIAKGHGLLDNQRALLRTCQHVVPPTAPPPVTPPRSILDHYVAAGFAGPRARTPSTLATTSDSP